jgi:hypothetical protein
MFFPSFGRPSVTLKQICYYTLCVSANNKDRAALVSVEFKENISVTLLINTLNISHPMTAFRRLNLSLSSGGEDRWRFCYVGPGREGLACISRINPYDPQLSGKQVLSQSALEG